MQVAIHTLGCKVNQYETAALENALRARGHALVPFEGPADAYIINTCTVTAVSDKKSRQAIRQALKRAPGAVVAVSHDRYFLDKVARRLLVVEGDGHAGLRPGGYTDYLEARRAAEREKRPEPSPEREKRQERPAGSQKLRFSYKEQREFETIDGDIAALEGEIAAVKAEQEKCASDYVALQDLQERQAALEARLEEKLERWVYLNDLAERIAGQ